MKATAFAPCHISGFFQPIYHKNIYQTGSRGAGINLENGVHATIELVESETSEITISLEGNPLDSPVINTAIRHLRGSEQYKVNVSLTSDIPAGQGFGISGASALSTAIALCSLLKKPQNDAWKAAHRAEIELKTGLGDVAAQIHGGVEIREQPGIPPWGKIISIHGSYEIIICILDSSMSTSDILQDSTRKNTIATIGKKCTDTLLTNPSFHHFMKISQEFTKKSSLASPRILEAMDAAKKSGEASMSMLGNSVFAVGDANELISILTDYGDVYRSNVDSKGARIISSSD